MEMRKRRQIAKSVATLYRLKDRMNKNIELISLITETESWNELDHVTLCLTDCDETIDAIRQRIREIEHRLK